MLPRAGARLTALRYAGQGLGTRGTIADFNSNQGTRYYPLFTLELYIYAAKELLMTTSWLDRNRGVLFSVLSVVAIGGATTFYLRQPASEPIEIVASVVATATIEATATPPLPTPTPAPVRVYITGAVVKSDVYFLPAGSIIKDAIAAAGGLSPEADPERIRSEEHTSELQSLAYLVCRLLLEKKN